jgi:stage II sporulation protein M
MSKITSTDNSFLHRSNEYFRGLYNRNKKLIALSAGIFFIAVLIGIIMGYFFPSVVKNFLLDIVRTDRLYASQNGITTLSILTHNFYDLFFITYIGGITGVVTAFVLVTNGFSYGAFLGYLGSNHLNSPLLGAITPQLFLLFTVPHGIFEFTSFIIAGAGGFRITKVIYSLLRNRGSLSDHYWELKDSLALLIIATVLIVIAAIIEANYTVQLGSYIIHQHL